MKKLLLPSCLVACFLLWPGAALSQTQMKPEPARTVKHQTLTSSSLPSIRIKFDKSFKYVGTQKFVLYERSLAEQFFFVDADRDGQIRSMYLVQFEGYLPNINATYDYPVTETVALGGQTYITNADAVPNVSAVLKQEPQSDVARAVEFLKSKGFRFAESVRYQRYVRVVDNRKQNEFILVYVEGANATTPLKPDDELSKRALKNVRFLN